jgi:PAS domain-containing protein
MNDTSVAPVPGADLDHPLSLPGMALESRHRKLFEGALLGIYVSRPDGRLVACNEAFARMLGFDSVAEAVRTGMRSVYSDVVERDRFLSRVREQGRLEHYRGRLRRRTWT